MNRTEIDVLVRPEVEADRADVHALNIEAFGQAGEADLVDRLRAAGAAAVSLVAVIERAVVGHILFSPVSLTGQPGARIAGLAPMAVSPRYQRQGVGSALIRAGLDECRRAGYGAVVVVGHPGYYPRFGFEPATGRGIRCEYDVPPEAFMVVELEGGYLDRASGTIRYHPAFAAVEPD